MTTSPIEPPNAFIAALRRIIAPLVRMLIAHNITLPLFIDLLKKAYVDTVEQDFRVNGERPTDSRISLLTGVHRKDVRRLRNEVIDPSAPPESISIGAQLISTWLTERRYTDGEGKPKRLPLRHPSSRRVSFESLVAAVARQDLRPRVVLDELLRLGIVELADDDHVVLKVEGFAPRMGFDEKAHYLGQNLRDHIAATANNLDEDRSPMFERAVSYHGLTTKDVEILDTEARQMGTDLLKEINRRALKMKKRNLERGSATQRINFGLYFFHGPDDGSDA